MEFVLLMIGIIALPFLILYLQGSRERQAERQFERIHDPNVASATVDGLVAQSKVDTEIMRDFGKRGV